MVIEACAPVHNFPAEPLLSAELQDGIADHLAHAADPADRASIVTALVMEIYDTAAWLVDSPGSCELDSMRQVLAEAQAHQARMTDPNLWPAGSAASFQGSRRETSTSRFPTQPAPSTPTEAVENSR